MEKKKKVNKYIRLTFRQNAYLEKTASFLGCSIQTVIRKIIDKYEEQEKG